LPTIYLIAVSVKDFQDMGMELSREVAAAVPEVIKGEELVSEQNK